MAATEVFEQYEELCPWHHREPFADGVQKPLVLRPDDSYFVSWAPAPGNSTPSWITVSTERVNAGVFLVQPGGWFDSGNHPGPEPYYIIKGTLHLSNPATGDVCGGSAGQASNTPAFAHTPAPGGRNVCHPRGVSQVTASKAFRLQCGKPTERCSYRPP